VNKCLTLLDQFKQEKNYGNSPLVDQAAKEVKTFYRKLKDQLDGLDQNMQRQRYIKLSVQAVIETGEGVLEQQILEQTAQMDKYSKAVEDIKRNNIEAFREIYFILDSHKIPKPIRQLPAYQTSTIFKPEGVIFAQACVNIDEFWLKEIKSRGFSKETNLKDFIMLIENVALFKYPINERRMELFEATQATDGPLNYI